MCMCKRAGGENGGARKRGCIKDQCSETMPRPL